MKHLKLLSLLLMATFGVLAFTACGDDDSGDKGKGNGNITPEQLIGTWYGVDENSSKKINIFVMNFATIGTGHYAEYKAKAEENWVPREPQSAEMTWTLTNGTLNANVNGTTRKGDILSINGNKITVRRYLDEGRTDEIVMTRVNSADEFMQIFYQMIATKTGGGTGEASILGTWGTKEIKGSASDPDTKQVIENWDNYPSIYDADTGKESLKYMEFTFGENSAFKLQQFDDQMRTFTAIMEGTWKQEGNTLSVDFGNGNGRTVELVSLTADKLVIHMNYIDYEFRVKETGEKRTVIYDETIYFSRVK